MIRITGRQCRQARALLKWNLQDLASRCRILNARRIEEFERGSDRLSAPESKEIFDIFEKQGVGFRGENDVKLNKRSGDSDHHSPAKAGGGGGATESERIDVTDEMMNQATDDRTDATDKKERDRIKRGADHF